MNEAPRVRFDAFAAGDFARSFRFAGYAGTIRADRAVEVLPALRELEQALAKGLWAAGFLAYGAAAGFDPAYPAGQAAGLPLLWFALYRERLAAEHASLPLPAAAGVFNLSGWRNGLGPAAYLAGVQRIRDYIAAGDTYQVNYTFPRTFRFAGDPAALYQELCRSQQAPFCADLAFDQWRILSASPELFFARAGDELTVRPMKGTASRGRWTEEDRAAAAALQASRKEQAENLMIVDLMRNDLGKLAIPGSVEVPALFAVETLPTLHQMTSTVTARLRRGTGLAAIMQALFPCGSVTGAPKRRTMEIIHELERRRRGLYTGCIGFAGPTGEAVFSVAIRTTVIDRQRSRGEIGIGSGITWDAQPAAEYAECRAKAAFMTRRFPEFRLVETMLHEDGRGLVLLDRHLQRLAGSAAYFAYRFDAVAVGRALAAFAGTISGRVKVRLLLARDGAFSIESAPLPAGPDSVPVRLRLSRTRVDERDPFLFHKTTHRPLYQREAAAHPGEEVIFRNRRGEITEGVTTNLVARLDGRLVTPPLACGLLPGVLRAELLASGTIGERPLTLADLRRAEELLVINSVRGWRPALLARSNAVTRV